MVLSCVHVLNKPQTYPPPRVVLQELLVNGPDDYLKWDAPGPTSGWERKICRISLVFGPNCSIISRMMIDLHPFPVSLCVLQRCQLQGEGVTPRLWKLQRTSKTLRPVIMSWSGHGKATTGRDSAFGQVEIEYYCMTSVNKTLVGWDWSWQMSKSWPKMIALITTHIQMYEVMILTYPSSKMFSLHVKKVSCKEQMWIF